jgi:hypothetical protein
MLDNTDLSDEGSIQYQDRRVQGLDEGEAKVVVDDFNEAIKNASSPKEIIDVILAFAGKIGKMFVVLFLVFALVGCGTKRPPAVLKAQSYKEAVFNSAVSDWQVRNNAHYKGLEKRGEAKVAATTEANLARARNNIEMIGGKPHVFRVVNGVKHTRPIDQYIMDCITLRDEEKAKVGQMIADEKSEDAKIARKFAMIKTLTALEQKYYQKIEDGTITADDAQRFVDEAALIITPFLDRGDESGRLLPPPAP